jgi:hypothetical protein
VIGTNAPAVDGAPLAAVPVAAPLDVAAGLCGALAVSVLACVALPAVDPFEPPQPASTPIAAADAAATASPPLIVLTLPTVTRAPRDWPMTLSPRSSPALAPHTDENGVTGVWRKFRQVIPYCLRQC